MNTAARSRWRDAIAFSWLGVALLYTIYAASTYTGLYEWLAERELAIFGSYDPTELFLVLVVASVVIAGAISPKPFGPSATWLKPATVDPRESSRSSAKALAGIAVVSLLVGLGAAGMALLRDPARHPLAVLNLAQPGAPVPSNSTLSVTGKPQLQFRVVIEETTNGSTTRTAYTPLTSPDWRPGQPIFFVTREAYGEGNEPVEPLRPPGDLVRFGPAAVFHHALPGMVRVGFARSRLTLAPRLLVLDTDLRSSSQTLWVVSLFGILFAVIFFVLLVTVRRAQRHDEAAAISERALSSSQASPPAPSVGPRPTGAARRWELRLGGELLAELFFEGYEFPWIEVSVKPRSGMQPFWRGFQEEAPGVNTDAGLEAMYVEVERRGGFTLIPDGEPPTDSFTLVNFDKDGGNLRY